MLILFAAFQVFVIGMLADLVGRATRARDEVQPAVAAARPTISAAREADAGPHRPPKQAAHR